jgi:Protein of unknown function (DUF2637)
MNDDPRSEARSATFQAHKGFRLLALVTVIIGVLALATAAFVFSYAGVHHMALAAGVPAGLARFYPALPDAVLVVACAAALALRGAKWWARWLVWLSIIFLAAAVGTADAVHAMAIKVPHRLLAATIAVVPWVLLLLGFRLWLSVLRHPRREAALAGPGAATSAAPAAAMVPDTRPEAAGEPGDSAAREPGGEEAPEPAGERAEAPANEADGAVPVPAGGAASESWDSGGEPWDDDAANADAGSGDGDRVVGAPAETSLTGLDLVLGPRQEEPASEHAASAPPLSAPVPEQPQPAEAEAAEAGPREPDAETDSAGPAPARGRPPQPPSPDFHRVRSSPVRPRE